MRLIDADRFDVLSYTEKSEDFTEGVEFVVNQIDNAKTVIELPDNPTNGDVIKALFPNALIPEPNEGDSYVSFWYTKEEDGRYVNFRKFWWDTPYKKNIED